MQKFAVAAVAALALAAGTPAAHAATFLTLSPPAADGSFTGTFGDNNIAAGDFTDIFTFTMPTGVASGTISSSFTTDVVNNIDFTTVTLDGHDFDIGSTGQTEFRSINNVLTTAGTQTLVVKGSS